MTGPLRLENVVKAWWPAPLLFLLLLRFGVAPSLELDASWMEVLQWASIHGKQMGVDIIFTYGPLGFLHPLCAYYPGHERAFLYLQITLAAGEAVLLSLALRGASVWLAICVVSGVAGFSPWIAGDAAWFLIFAFSFAIVANLEAAPFHWQRAPMLIMVSMLLATLALIKFTALVVFFLWVCASAALLFQRKQYLLMLSVLLGSIVALLFLWIGAGQKLSNIPAYLHASFEIASGYGAAMGQEPSRRLLSLGICSLTICMIAIALAVFRKGRKSETTITVGFFGALIFLVWRSGFTRADHASMFFAFAGLAPFAGSCIGIYKFRRGGAQVLAVLSLIFSLVVLRANVVQSQPLISSEAATVVANNVDTLLHLNLFGDGRRADWSALSAAADLPRMREVIGNATVDIFTTEQGVLLANGFNYQPRPVFQSYSAYTPFLAHTNEAHFLSAQSPQFVIVRLQPIDERFPMQEDGLAMAAIFQRYRPRLFENGYLLLERTKNTGMKLSPPEASAYRDVAMGEELQIPKGEMLTVAFVETQLTAKGSARAIFLREPELQLQIRTTEGDIRVFRLVRSTAKSGFIVSPLIESTLQIGNLSRTLDRSHVQSIAITPAKRSFRRFFVRTVRIALSTLPASLPMTDMSAFAEGGSYPGLSVNPIGESRTFDMVREHGRDAIFMHAPAWLEFELTKGNYHITGVAGIRDVVLESFDCVKGHADGVGVSALLTEAEASPRIIWHRNINPFLRAEDRGGQPIDINVSVDHPAAVLRIEFDKGELSGGTICDWSYLSDLQITNAGKLTPQ